MDKTPSLGKLAKPHYIAVGKTADAAYPYDSDLSYSTTSGAPDEYKGKKILNDDTSEGVPSLMNHFAYVTLHGVGADGDLLYDISGQRKWYDKTSTVSDTYNYKDPSVANLIDFFGDELNAPFNRGHQPYSYTDFAYCKWFGRIPNNRLITLRRYTMPIFDSLELPDWAKKDGNSKERTLNNNIFIPMAQAVTWFGDETGNALSDLMKFDVKLPWEDLNGSPDTISVDAQQQGSTMGASNSPGVSSAFKMISILTGEGDPNKAFFDGHTPNDPYSGGPYSNRVLGPVNRIEGVKKRKAGLEFKQTIELTFEYQARSLGAVNPKAAMLDIMANFLVLGYGAGAFWGGMRRFRGPICAYPWKEGMRAWYSGDPVAMINASKNAMARIGDKLSSLLKDFAKDPLETLKKIAGDALNSGAGALMKALGASPHNAPYVKALLTGEPVGEWHLVVGNPFAPIMQIGNLVCSGVAFEFNDELGPDDFPTEMKVKVTLEHGMGRDRHAVESMFNQGMGRIYTIPDGIEENASGNGETKVDKYTGKNRENLGSGQYKPRGGKAYWEAAQTGFQELRQEGARAQAKCQPAYAAASATSKALVKNMLDGDGSSGTSNQKKS